MKLIDWLFGDYIRILEAHYAEHKISFNARMLEKDAQLRSLRMELARVKEENDRMRLVLMPLGSPAGAMYAQKFQTGQMSQVENTTPFHGPQDWQGELNKMLEEEEDGIRNRRRVQEHESSADDGA